MEIKPPIAPRVVIMEVAPNPGHGGLLGMKQVLRVKRQGDPDFADLPASQIMGFDYKEGTYYKLKVEEVPVKSSILPGQPSVEYTLLEIMERQKV